MVALDPLRESAQRLLIQASLAQGNRAEAIRQLDRYERHLRRELGITVSRVESRYERLNRKLEAPSKRYAVERAVALGVIKPTS